jgi:hypothetical protein
MLKLKSLKNHQINRPLLNLIESYVGPSSEGPGNGVKMSAEFYKYATDKIKK